MNDHGCDARFAASSSALRVPFGDLNGRLMRPTEVDPGLKCGCVCPGCRTRLVARNQGLVQQPHFTHREGGEQRACFETAVHRMSKQIVADALAILVPGWSRRGPPARDLDGVDHDKDGLVCPAEVRTYARAAQEVSFGAFVPDVVLTADSGEQLLVEILVHHRVDAAKAQRVRVGNWSMIEIDVSTVTQDQLRDGTLEDLVLRAEGNRRWIHDASAEAKFLKHQADLQERLAQINEIIRQRRHQNELRRQALDTQHLQQMHLRLERDRLHEERERHRQQLAAHRRETRAPHEEALQWLKARVDSGYCQAKLADMREQNFDDIHYWQQDLFGYGRTPRFLLDHDPGAWIFHWHPQLWQLLLCREKVVNTPDEIIDTRGWGDWVADACGMEFMVPRLVEAERQLGAADEGGVSFLSREEQESIPLPARIARHFVRPMLERGILKPLDEGRFLKRGSVASDPRKWSLDSRTSF